MGIKSRYERIEKMKSLIEELNNASIAYYTSTPIMSDYDWDKKYEELQMLENQENIIFPNSPTQNVGYTVSDKLNEVKLDHLMLSLDKTKSINNLKQFAGNKQCIASVKCDGLSTTLKYIRGELVSGAGGVNEVQYACLQMMIAKATGYKPGKFTHFVANEQIYDRHFDAANELINRANTHKLKISTSSGHYDYEFEPVKMSFNPKSDNFYDFTIEDFSLENYNPIKPNLKLELGV